MGGKGSGGARPGAGRTRFVVVLHCQFCARRFTAFRLHRAYCDDHRRPRDRRGEDQAALVRAQLQVALRRLEKQFAPFGGIVALVREMRAGVDALGVDASPPAVQTSALADRPAARRDGGA